jgi:lipoprotein-anchoring transpeptidase ErfK/SrfK
MPRTYRSRRKKKSRRRLQVAGVIVVLTAVGAWWWLTPREAGEPESPTADQVVAQAEEPAAKAPARPSDFRLVADEELVTEDPNVAPTEPEAPADEVALVAPPDAADDAETGPPAELAVGSAVAPEPSPALEDPTAVRASHAARSGDDRIEAARKLYDAGQLVAARGRLNDLLARGLSDSEAREVRALLTKIADETIFGRKVYDNDPLTSTYAVQSGDYLITIGKKYKVPHEVLMKINNISDPRRIRVGQKLKVVRGPFNARIDKSDFRMDLYLGDVYVRSYRVGLGSENGTPEGTWQVEERLPNPTYYPPASAPDKRIIPPNDPQNPLGEHWISLKGLRGAALGREGYGIHGTIEPESIGQAVSLGCVRMHNEDVAFVYALLMPGQSVVTIEP